LAVRVILGQVQVESLAGNRRRVRLGLHVEQANDAFRPDLALSLVVEKRFAVDADLDIIFLFLRHAVVNDRDLADELAADNLAAAQVGEAAERLIKAEKAPVAGYGGDFGKAVVGPVAEDGGV